MKRFVRIRFYLDFLLVVLNSTETLHHILQINDIQKVQLSDEYESIALQPQYGTNQLTEHLLEKNETVVDDDGNTFEILVISDDFEQKLNVDNEIEEFELLEVDHVDAITESNEPSNEHSQDEATESNPELQQKDEIVEIQTKSNGKKEIKAKMPTGTLRKSARQMLKTQQTIQSRHALKKNGKKYSVAVKTEKQTKPNGKASDQTCEMESMQQDCDDIAEGESDNEFPARDTDNEDWPSQETLDGFPKTIIKDGLLLVKGKELMSMICRYD